MTKPGLRSRLFWSHLIVMGVGLLTLLTVGKVYSPRFFVIFLQRIDFGGAYHVSQVRGQLVQSFEAAWSRGALWSVVVGASAAAGLSYWFTKRIVRPLEQMETVTQKFAAGDLDAKVPVSDIPELQRLATSFNRMAIELKDVEQRRRDLISDLTHELRTPLTVLEGYLEGLADGTIDPSSDIYQRLANETTRLKRLVNDLQELSKLEAGYFPIEAKPFDLDPLIQMLIQKFSDQQISDVPTFQLEHCELIPKVCADPERVEQILINLMGNAIRHTVEGRITIAVTHVENWVWIAVIDTGEGIAEEDLPHIFERFWRADRSRDRHSGGTGIGLAITRRLVELQGGIITVESQLHHGSTFRFSLPVA